MSSHAQRGRRSRTKPRAKSGTQSKAVMVMVAFGLTGMNPLPGSESGGYFGKLGLTAGDRGVHPHRHPDMAVGVAQAAAVHEAVIMDRSDVGLTPMKGRGSHHRIEGDGRRVGRGRGG